MKATLLLVSALFLAGCATTPVPESREQQVEQITETGPYSYERAVDPLGPGR